MSHVNLEDKLPDLEGLYKEDGMDKHSNFSKDYKLETSKD